MSDNNFGGKQPAESIKPKFDKKKWREKKYSNKYKVDQWEKRREKALIRQYYKELKKDPVYSKRLESGGDVQTESAEPLAQNSNSELSSSDVKPSLNKPKRKKFNCYEAARAEIQKRKEEKEKQMEERAKKKSEMDTKLAEYRKKRADKYRVLSRKNLKGQPIMKGRLQHLYDQIQQSLT